MKLAKCKQCGSEARLYKLPEVKDYCNNIYAVSCSDRDCDNYWFAKTSKLAAIRSWNKENSK